MEATYISNLDGLGHNDIDSPLSANGDPFASRKANALSTKLATVLSSSYADSEIREALRLLDLRKASNANDTRQDLKSSAQREVIDANGRIIEDFSLVAEQLKRVGALIDSVNRTCDEMRIHIVAARQESAPVMEEASILLARKRETEAKQNILEAFRKHFIVSDHDLNVLTNTAEPLNEDYFNILQRVKGIHKDCEILLGYENQRLGLELMEQTTRNLDAGFKKLYTWIQREFKGLDLEDPHISGSIRRALRVLSERPTLFQNCLDFFAEARESTLSDAFQSALTGTNHTQAIEFSTHDPLRYIGDMLAWVHSAAVSEKEALEGLFISDADEINKSFAANRASEPWARIKSTTSTTTAQNTNLEIMTDADTDTGTIFDGRRALNSLVSRTLTTVSSTLYSRIEVAVRNATGGDAVLVYKIYNLLTFYRDIFAKQVSADTSIGKTISQLESFTLASFEEMVEEETANATADNTPPADLSPPSFLTVALKQFGDVCKARGPQMGGPELERLFSGMVTGPLESCAEGAMGLADAREKGMYKVNYLMALRNALEALRKMVPGVGVPLEKADEEIEAMKAVLVEFMTAGFLEESGVAELLQEMDGRQDAEVRRNWLEENLEGAAQKLDAFLASGLMDAQEGLRRLVDKGWAGEVLAESVERFCDEFVEVERMLEAADEEKLENGVDNEGSEGATLLRELYPRSVVEVKALLS